MSGRSPKGSHDVELEPPIRTMIDATNRGDTPTLLGAFSDDAVLTDWGRTFSGKAAIARWNGDENIGAQTRMLVTGVERSGHEVKVSVVVSGGGFNGAGVLSFELDGRLITRLVIS